MPSTTITIGTTPAKLLDLIRGLGSYAGASASKTYAGLPHGNGAQLVIFQADPTNTQPVYFGSDSTVSSTNKGLVLNSGEAAQREGGGGMGVNHVPLNTWLVAGGAGQLVNVTFEYA